MVGAFAVCPRDQRVAPEQPACARVGEITLRCGSGRGAPLRAVCVLGPFQQWCGRRRDTPAGREADTQIGELHQAVAECCLLEIDESDSRGGMEVIAGAGVAVEQGMPGCLAQSAHEVLEFAGHARREGNLKGRGQPEEGVDVGLVRASPRGKCSDVLRAGGGVQPGQCRCVVDDPVAGGASVVQTLQHQHPLAGVGGQQCGHHRCGSSSGEPQGGHLAGVSLVGVGAGDELLHHHLCFGQLNAPHTRARAAAQPARAPG